MKKIKILLIALLALIWLSNARSGAQTTHAAQATAQPTLAQPTLAVTSTSTLTATQVLPATLSSQDVSTVIPELKGAITNIHDPVLIKADGMYYIFSTGYTLPIHCSKDMVTWSLCGTVFLVNPLWVVRAVPGVRDLWAPDISYYGGLYHLYYSASTFGSNWSSIGLVTNVTLDASRPDYKWVDQGEVFSSRKVNDYNAIDPNLAFDKEGQPWLAFGSFWSGIKLRKIDPATGKLAADDPTIYSLARRSGVDAIEGSFITRRGNYYYLFVSFDFCCQGVNSTYKMMVGRSTNITGPYVDRDGHPMLDGGGTLLYSGSARWRGPGHNGIMVDQDSYWIVYHAYDADHAGIPTAHIELLEWDGDDWPILPSARLGL